MTNNILAINFYNADITAEKKAQFNTAVSHELAKMRVQAIEETIASIQNKIANKNGTYSEEDIVAFKAQLETVKADKIAQETIVSETKADYEIVFAAMTVEHENKHRNHPDVVRTVLRVLASYDDSKLVKYAIIPAFQSKDLYDAMQAIHVNSKAGDNGQLVMSQEVKAAYHKASDTLESIIKNTFSLPFETEYTAKTRVKLNGADKKLLNDCYIKGFKNNFTTDSVGKVSFTSRQVNTLIKVKKTKDGERIDYSGIASTIANIVIKHYFE